MPATCWERTSLRKLPNIIIINTFTFVCRCWTRPVNHDRLALVFRMLSCSSSIHSFFYHASTNKKTVYWRSALIKSSSEGSINRISSDEDLKKNGQDDDRYDRKNLKSWNLPRYDPSFLTWYNFFSTFLFIMLNTWLEWYWMLRALISFWRWQFSDPHKVSN